MRFASDGRVFVAEKSGLIKVFASISATTPTIFADLRTNVHNYWDRGLLGLALHPNFPATPYVYVLYTYDASIGGGAPTWGTVGGTWDGCGAAGGPADGCLASGRLSRLTAVGNVASGPEQVLVEDWAQQFPNHSMGSLAFGADGALYVSAGDGASGSLVDYGQKGQPKNACGDPPVAVGGTQTAPSAEGGALRSQDLRTTADANGYDGTILRLDPTTGAALPSNPLAGGSASDDDRIVAYGLRNPSRITVRPGTSEVWIGDAGWTAAEEVDRIVDATAGVTNFGWPCYEGAGHQPAFDAANLALCQNLYAAGPGAVAAPYYAYQHGQSVVAGDGCGTGTSIISGLAFYPSGSYPASYNGALFFSDYGRSCIWAMLPGGNGLPDPNNRVAFSSGAAHPVDLQVGPGGDLFYVDLDGGTIRRIRYFSGNQPPVAVVTANKTNGTTPLTVQFDASGSSDPNPGDTLTYDWDLNGDGVFGDASGAQPSTVYSTAGVRTVSVRVTDQLGSSSVATIVVSAGNTPPAATLSAPTSLVTWSVGDTIAFSGSATDAQDGALQASSLTWTLTLQECPSGCTPHVLQKFVGVGSGSFVAPDFTYPSALDLTLTATDSGGLTDTKTVTLQPKTVTLGFASTPTGMSLAVGGSSQATPFNRTVIVNSATSVGALSPQSPGASAFKFSSWSDAGAASHTIAAPSSATNLSATFTAACVDGSQSCDDGNACTTDSCDAVLGCVHTAVTCNDSSACTTDTCNPATGCVFTPITCNDGSACTTDTCNQATGCVFTPITCNDGNACTTDTCNPTTGCVFTPASCDDGNVCTTDSCDPASGCIHANNTLPCNDSNVCTTIDTCSNGSCVGSGALSCDDGNVCTDDVCDSLQGCLHATNSNPCSDANSCTTGDVCNGGVCVGGNVATGCTSCQAAAIIPAQGGTFLGKTSGTSSLSGSCGTSNTSPERVYQWTPTTSGVATISTCGGATLFDTILYLKSGSCAAGSQVACNDDTNGCTIGDGTGHGSKITPTVTAGQTYYIVVDGYSGGQGNFSLTVSPPTICGNNVREGLEQCDGTDVSACGSGQCTASCTCVAPVGGLPDLVPAVTDWFIQYNATVATGDVQEGCAEATSGVNLLRFGVRSFNVGTADFTLGDPGCPLPCDQHPLATCTNPQFICSPAQGHNHAHYTNYAKYELLDASGQALVVGHKQGFCLLDGGCVQAKYTCTNQGLTAGCYDNYGSNLGCQYLDITGVPDGQYTLRVTIDPFQRISELDESNNVFQLPVTLGQADTGQCPTPIPVPASGGVFTGTTTGTTTQTGTCGGGGAPEVVYQWTPSVSGTATVDTCNSVATTFDTVLYVRQGACGAGTEVACNDDTVGCGMSGDGTSPRRASRATFSVTAGTTYYVLVDGYIGQSGAYSLTITPPAGGATTTTTTVATTTTSTVTTTTSTTVPTTTTTVPATTTTTTTVPTTTTSTTPSTTVTTTSTTTIATTSTSSTTVTTVTTTTSTSITTTTIAGGGTCTGPIVIPPSGGTFTGTTTGTSAQSGTCASTTTAPEKVFAWTPSVSGTATVETCSASATAFDTVLYVRQGVCGTGTQLGCNDDAPSCPTVGDTTTLHGSRVSAAVTAGQTYYIFVDGYSGSRGNFSLTVYPPGVLTTTTSTTTTSTSTTTSTTIASGGACASPTVIPAAGGTFTGTTSGTSSLSGTCSATNTSPEQVYQWTPTTSGTATIQTCNTTATTFDTVLYLRQTSCANGTQVACNDDTTGCGIVGDGASPRHGSKLTPAVTAGQTYFIVVDGYSGVAGNYSLNVIPPP